MTTAIQELASSLWSMEPRALDSLVHAARNESVPAVITADADFDADVRDPSFSAMVTRHGFRELPGARVAAQVDNVAVIPIFGAIRPRPMLSLFGMSFGTNLMTLAHDLEVALASPEIDSILFEIDSPGGNVTGVEEFAGMVFKARQRKRIVAHVQGMGASAALWIGTAASEFVVGPTAEAGSIGVVAVFVDFSEFDEKVGIKEIEIVSSQSPNKRLAPTTDSGRALVQRRVDALADVFIARVAQHRSVDQDTVISEFGRGDLLVGEAAVAAGLADRLAGFDEVLEELAENSRSHTGGIQMSDTVERSAVTAELIAAEFPQVADALRAEGLAAGRDDLLAEGRKLGAEEERARIQAIAALNVPVGLKSYHAEAMFDGNLTAADVALEMNQRQARGELDKAELHAVDAGGPLAHEEPDQRTAEQKAAEEAESAARAAAEAVNASRR